MKKAVLFDRDGTINYRFAGDYIKKTNELIMLDDFLSFYKLLKNNDFYTFLVTNQQGIGKGLMTNDDLYLVHNFMQEQLKSKFGSGFDDILFCPELASSNSFYRKPNPGMLIQTIEKWELDKEHTWMIGDSMADVHAAKAAGIKCILIGFISEEADFSYINFYELCNSFDVIFLNN